MESLHHGEIAVAWQEEEGCQFKGMENFGPNVVSFLLTLGGRGWYVIRAYMPSNGVPVVHWIYQALVSNPKGVETI